MKLLNTEIDWEYPDNNIIPEPFVMDLDSDNENVLIALILGLGSGIYIECAYEVSDHKAYEVITGALQGVGAAKKIEVNDVVKSRSWLYKEGYDCYCQGDASYFFVNPVPRAELFQDNDLTTYMNEFRQSEEHRKSVIAIREDDLLKENEIQNQTMIQHKVKNRWYNKVLQPIKYLNTALYTLTEKEAR